MVSMAISARGHRDERRSAVNVGDAERKMSAIGGGLLAAYGIYRGDWLGLGLAAAGGGLIYRGLTGHCACFAALGIDTAQTGPATSVRAGHGVRVDHTIIINRPPEEVYRFWRQFRNLSRFMHNLVEVREVDGKRSHWIAVGPLGARVEWDAVIINEKPNELIAWRSLEGAAVANAGSVHFRPAPDGRGTEVRVELKYDPPAGRAGAALAWLFGKEPTLQIAEDLRRFKQVLETGDTALSGNGRRLQQMSK